jgi:hypothetical protein
MPSSDPSADDNWWGSIGFMVGLVRGDQIPPLVTTSPAGTPQAAAGILAPGNPVRILWGGKPANDEFRPGLRAELGYWLDSGKTLAVEGGVFALDSAFAPFSAVSNGNPILARPFFNTSTGLSDAVLVAFPGLSSGSIRASDIAQRMYGLNVDLRENFCCTPRFRLDGLVGYRALSYTEHLNIQQSLQPTSGAFPAGSTIVSTDGFGTRNVFNGIDAGLRAEFFYDSLSVGLTTKVAAGTVTRGSTITGTQVVMVPGSPPAVSQGGVLALASNLGTHPSWTYTGVPEITVSLGWQMTSNISVGLSYWVMWWPQVFRPGEQVDTSLNSAQFPGSGVAAAGAVNPAVLNHQAVLWVQALTFSLEIRF